jgi:hypothetical protein
MLGAKRNRLDAQSSVVVGAAQVVAALGANELAMMPGQPVRARGAHLAMVLDRKLDRRKRRSRL